MSRFMFLYIGPEAVDLGMAQSTLSDSDLDQWAQAMGPKVIDRGAVFGSNGASVLDTGRIDMGEYFIHGYSIVQAESLDGAIELTRNHPFIAKKGVVDASFEIQVLDFTTGSRPIAPVEYTPKDRGLIPDNLENRGAPGAVPNLPQQSTVISPQAPQRPQEAQPPNQFSPNPPGTSPAPGEILPPPAQPGELNIPHYPPEDNQR